MRYIPLFAGVLLICAPAKADKFWLTDPNTKQSSVAGSSPNLIEGVIVAEKDGLYHVRIVGGQVMLAKKSIFKVEKDDIYEAVAALTKKVPDRIQVFYKEGTLHIAAE